MNEINPSPNTQQLSGFSPVCVHMCMARWDEWEKPLAALNTSILPAFYVLFWAASVDVRMLLQQVLYVEALVIKSAHVLVVEVDVEVASDTVK